MSAGTIVISGGILAGVILLCIIAVLCYCRLQYYCCKKNESEVDIGSMGADPLGHFPCNACAALEMDGTDITPVSLDQLGTGSPSIHCPSCSPGLSDGLRNGGERLGFHTYYENPSLSLPQCADPQASPSLSFYSSSDIFPPPPMSYSTDV